MSAPSTLGPLPLPPDVRISLQGSLHAGESVLWSALPTPGAHGNSGFALWLFAIPWSAFSVFWETVTVHAWLSGDGMGLFGVLFGVPFVAIGVAMLLAPFLGKAKAKRTVTVLSTMRLFTVVQGARTRVRSIPLHQIGPITRDQRADGTGDLRVQTQFSPGNDHDSATDTFWIRGVPDVAGLERLILAQVAAAVAMPPGRVTH